MYRQLRSHEYIEKMQKYLVLLRRPHPTNVCVCSWSKQFLRVRISKRRERSDLFRACDVRDEAQVVRELKSRVQVVTLPNPRAELSQAKTAAEMAVEESERR
ncbi:Protein of unknown function [Gryllus bimaculatus]|nr:Protein of unknown function [Gryllus bimaculatus]